MIPAERWERAKELFDEALGVETERRAAFLAENSAGDETLRLEVESLLASHERAGAFLDAGTGDDTASPSLGRVGPYRLLGLLGRGGMGDVYRAVRDDDHFKKVVAVKLVRPDLAGELEESRLRTERQILAGLEHPGVARLLDGGSTEDGRPFLVMEYVDGVRLDAFARERGLDTRARVALFRQICAAVQHAHQNLIVHRDLKPANILVTPEGMPKLLDFGVAKLLDPTLAGESTTTAFAAMTPAYASPEQVRGEPITTASDIYSLGAVLYELITGVRAHRLGGRALQAAVCDEMPERPSAAHRAAHPTGGRRRLRRSAWDADLDAIVLKALRKEPARRYATVDAFSDDLRRYLEGLPVTAAKGTFTYRARRFVRRNKVAVGLAAALLGLAGAYLANDAMQAKRLARQRDRAERVTAFLVDLFRVSEPSEARGNAVTAREMLDKGAAEIEAELRDEPEVRAVLLHTLGRVHEGLGLYAKAVSLHERGLSARRSALGPRHPDVAESLTDAGRALFRTGDHVRGEAYQREALAIRRAVFGDESLPVAESLTAVARPVYAARPEDPEAESLHVAALAIRRKLLPAADPAIADNLNYLGFIRRDRGDLDGAEALKRECLAIRRRAFPGASREVAAALNNLGTVLLDKADYAGAESVFAEALDIRTRIYGPDHPTLAIPLSNLAEVRRVRGDGAGAAELLRRTISVTERGAVAKGAIALHQSRLGRATCEAGDCAAAEALQSRALAAMREQRGPRHLYVSVVLTELAATLSAQGRWAEAEAALREAQDIAASKGPTGKTQYACVVTQLAEVLAKRGDAEAALSLAREGLTLWQGMLPAGHPTIASSESVLGAALAAAGRRDEAGPLLRRAHAALVASQGAESPAARAAAARAAAF